MTSRASASPSTDRTALVVAGMHRSGTSAMARVLSLVGAGMPDRVVTAAADNPLGFWEPADVVGLNNEILRLIGSEWNDVFGLRVAARVGPIRDELLTRARSVVALNYADMTLAVMKDPRVSLLAPLWRDALAQEGFRPVFVIMVRDPMEVAQSIAVRDGVSVQASALAWLSHMVAIERDTRDAPRVFVRYSDLVEDWRPVLARIQAELGLSLSVSKTAGEEVSRYLSRSERHHTTNEAEWIGRSDIWPGVAEAWRWLVQAASAAGTKAPFPDQIADDLETLASRMEPSLTSIRDSFLRREHDFQAMLGDRERVLLRLRAQAEEQRALVTEQRTQGTQQGDQLTTTLQEVAQLSPLIQSMAIDLARFARPGEAVSDDTGSVAHIRAQLETLSARLSALNDHYRTSQGRLVELEGSLEAKAAELTLTHDHAENLSGSLRHHEIVSADLAKQLSATQTRERELKIALSRSEEIRKVLQARVDAMSASASWALTRPMRVVQKRLGLK